MQTSNGNKRTIQMRKQRTRVNIYQNGKKEKKQSEHKRGYNGGGGGARKKIKNYKKGKRKQGQIQ
jgi:hypothetical protein